MNVCHICLKEISGEQKYPGYHNPCVISLFGNIHVSPFLDFDKALFKAEISQKYTKGMSISGVQKKLSMKIEANKLVPTSKDGKFILKPTVEDFPEISANEHLTMRLGEIFGIETPACGLIQFQGGELAYIVRRFDWTPDETKRILKEDMAQIFQLQRDKEETYKYSKSYEEVGLKILEITGSKLVNVLDYFTRVVFCFLTANGDYHLKNISVQNKSFNRDGVFDSLTPNYDALMTFLYFPSEEDLALDLLRNDEFSPEFKQNGFFTRADFNLLATRISLPPSGAVLVFNEMKKKLPQAFELIKRGFLSDKMKEKYQLHFTQRAKKLELI